MKKIILSILASLVVAPAFALAMESNSSMQSDLWVGSRGDAVVSLQNYLETNGFLVLPTGSSKGYFGMMTKMALQKYQRSLGVRATGYFGALTRSKMSVSMDTSSQSTNTNSNNSNSSMTDTNHAEAGIMVGGALMVASKDIVENALNANNVTTVVAAVKAAGLVDTLRSAGPFTVFAPNNEAFAKLPAGTVETLLKPENKAKLTDILTYHVVAGRYTSKDLSDGMALKTVEGKNLVIKKTGSSIWINGSAMVETSDVISRNGVTFVIDSVLMPASN